MNNQRDLWQHSLAAIRAQLRDGGEERRLHDLFGGVGILLDPSHRKAIQAGEISLEELVECRFLSGEHSPHEIGVWRRHDAEPALLSHR